MTDFVKEKISGFRKPKSPSPQYPQQLSSRVFQRNQAPRSFSMNRRPSLPARKTGLTETEKELERTMSKIKEMGKKK